MTYADWDKEIEALPLGQLAAVKEAMATLRRWQPFYREFKGLGMFGLEVTMAYEMEHAACANAGQGGGIRPGYWFNRKTVAFEPIPADDAEEVRS